MVAQLFRRIMDRPQNGELYCPLCYTLSNLAIPLPPVEALAPCSAPASSLSADIAMLEPLLR